MRFAAFRQGRRRLAMLATACAVAVAAAPGTAAREAAPRGRTITVPDTIPGKCEPGARAATRDVTAELNAVVAAAPNGTPADPTTILFRGDRCYRIDGTLGAAYDSTARAGFRRRHLVLDGRGATLDGSHSSPPPRKHAGVLSFVYGRDLTVRRFHIRGSHPDPCHLSSAGTCREGGYVVAREFQHGLAFYATRRVRVVDNTITDVYGDGVLLGSGWSARPGLYVTDAVVARNRIDGTGRMGVAVVAGVGVRIVDNVFDRVSYTVVDLEPVTMQPVRSITIAGNHLGRYWLSFVSTSTGNCARGNGGDVVIRDNHDTVGGATVWPAVSIAPYGQAGRCPFPKTWAHYLIEGNVFVHRGGFWAIRAARTADLLITRNVLRGADTAVDIADPQGGVRVERNVLDVGRYAYTVDGSYSDPGHRLGPGVSACGNRTRTSRAQPRPCVSG
jgi:hypothetical protein